MNGLEITFAVVGTVGFVFLLITLLIGELFDFGEGLIDDISGGDTTTDVGESSPSILSSRVLAAALTGFGAFGYAAASLGANDALAIIVAIGGFAFIGAGVFYLVVKPLHKQQFNATLNQQSYVGRSATVTLPIGGIQAGAVEFIDGNQTRVSRPATCSDRQRYISVGTQVTITQTTATDVVVE
jgi:hypothetical protein